jgi:6-phosphogluconolactonase
MNILAFDAATYAADAARAILDAIRSYKQGVVRVALCGGSTPKPIYAEIAQAMQHDTTLSELTLDLYLGDERFVPLSDARSNYKMIIESGLGDIPGRTKLYPLDISSTDVSEASKRYEELLNAQVPTFDIMLLGIGDDGHTASLFPNDLVALHELSKRCIAVTHPTDGTERMSMTLPVLESSSHIMFLAKGAAKAKLLSEVVAGEYSVETYPSTFWRSCPSKVTFLFDKPAAEML